MITNSLVDLSSVSDINYSQHDVSNGSKLDLSGATSYTTRYNSTIQAQGVGREIDLSSLTTMTGAWEGYTYRDDRLYLRALEGGKLNFSGLTEITSGVTDIVADGSNSLIDLSNLTQFIDNDNNPSQLVASNGGTILVPILTTLDGVNLNLNGTGTLDTSGFVNYYNGSATINGIIPDFSNLASVSASVFSLINNSIVDLSSVSDINYSQHYVSNGSKLDLSGATSYTTRYNSTIQAQGVGSEIDLSSLTTMTGAWEGYTYRDDRLYLRALEGAQT